MQQEEQPTQKEPSKLTLAPQPQARMRYQARVRTPGYTLYASTGYTLCTSTGYIHWIHTVYIYWIHTVSIYWIQTVYIYWLHTVYIYWIHTIYIYWIHTVYIYWIHTTCIYILIHTYIICTCTLLFYCTHVSCRAVYSVLLLFMTLYSDLLYSYYTLLLLSSAGLYSTVPSILHTPPLSTLICSTYSIILYCYSLLLVSTLLYSLYSTLLHSLL